MDPPVWLESNELYIPYSILVRRERQDVVEDKVIDEGENLESKREKLPKIV